MIIKYPQIYIKYSIEISNINNYTLNRFKTERTASLMKLTNNVIDSHIHIDKWFDSNGVSYIETLNKLQNDTGLKGMCIDALTDKIHGGIEINVMASIYKLFNPSAYAYANLFFPENPIVTPLPNGIEPLSQYNEFLNVGFDGIKILYKPNVQKNLSLPINDMYFDSFFAAAEKNNTHFIWHVADPKTFWDKDSSSGPWNYSDGTYPSCEELYEQTFDVLKRHPNLNVCFAHFLFLENEPEKLEEIFDKYKNVCVDVVPGLMFRTFEKRPDFYKAFLTKYSDRILFGSDSDVPSNPNCAKLIKNIYDGLTTNKLVNIWGYESMGINLSEEVSKKILYENFKNKCHPVPNPINIDALKCYIEKYSSFFTMMTEKNEILKFAKTL